MKPHSLEKIAKNEILNFNIPFPSSNVGPQMTHRLSNDHFE
jgi:hypothetical protein